MFGEKYLATRIAFLKDKLSKMVGGRFGNRRGEPAVYITYDPYDKTIYRNHCKVYMLNSQKGQFYTPIIHEYIKVKNEYDSLVNEWKQKYREPVPEISLPINSRLGAHKLDYEFFKNASAYQNPQEYTKKHKFNGDTFRSKNELVFAKRLTAMNIPFKVEPKVVLYPNTFNTSVVYPDFLIGLESINRSSYIEICGAMGTDTYNGRTKSKIVSYEENGYRDMKDIMMLYLSEDLDTDYMFNMLKALLEILTLDRDD